MSLTCVDLHAGFLAHVSQLDNHVVFPSWLQLLYGVLHRAVPALHFVDFICFPHQIFNCYSVELEGGGNGWKNLTLLQTFSKRVVGH